MKYKNLQFAFSIEVMFGLITSILIITMGPSAIAFLALFAIRPFVLEKEKLSYKDDYWFSAFQIGKYSLMIISIIIICAYAVDALLLSGNLLNIFKERIILLVPLYMLIHGILGLFSQRNSNHNLPFVSR
ncbi:MAG: hypothetical protein P8X47_12040 [Ignavibacteriaceae bacterium]